MKSYVLRLGAAVGFMLLVAVYGIHLGLGNGTWLKGPIAINSLAEFSVKRAAFQNLIGIKVALLGDSLMFGRVMAKELPHSWRENALDRQLEVCLRTKLGNGKAVHVVNFGQNGALPRDFGALLTQLANADAILLNVNNRSFSADFDSIATRHSRTWLAQLAKPQGQLDTQMKQGAIPAAWTRWLLAKRAWSDETTKDLTARLIAPILSYFAIEAKKNTGIDAILLLKLKSRYKTVSFARNNKQAGMAVQAKELAHILALQKVWAFKTAEHPKLIRRIARKSKRAKMTTELNALIKNAGASARFIQAPSNLETSEFLDLMHVRPSGYAKYTTSICSRLAAALRDG